LEHSGSEDDDDAKSIAALVLQRSKLREKYVASIRKKVVEKKIVSEPTPAPEHETNDVQVSSYASSSTTTTTTKCKSKRSKSRRTVDRASPEGSGSIVRASRRNSIELAKRSSARNLLPKSCAMAA